MRHSIWPRAICCSNSDSVSKAVLSKSLHVSADSFSKSSEVQRAKATPTRSGNQKPVSCICFALNENHTLINQDEQKEVPCSVVVLHDLSVPILLHLLHWTSALARAPNLELNNCLGCLVSLFYWLVGTLEAKKYLNSIQVTNFLDSIHLTTWLFLLGPTCAIWGIPISRLHWCLNLAFWSPRGT